LIEWDFKGGVNFVKPRFTIFLAPLLMNTTTTVAMAGAVPTGAVFAGLA